MTRLSRHAEMADDVEMLFEMAAQWRMKSAKSHLNLIGARNHMSQAVRRLIFFAGQYKRRNRDRREMREISITSASSRLPEAETWRRSD